ncbi:MBL fold metallo-hydrolase [bacterium]|nr:MBL fold metallo-hydrolase [bacterium]
MPQKSANCFLIHHGGAEGVTGSCHELLYDDNRSLLIDCGLFQGAEAIDENSNHKKLEVDFAIDSIEALLITHCHIDHVGRIPYLLAAGFDKKIYCTEATASLLPLVLEDALKIGFTKDRDLIGSFLKKFNKMIVPVPYGKRIAISDDEDSETNRKVEVRFKPAGHILGSAYIEVFVGKGLNYQKIVFSGDLGAPYTPLLPAPKSPYSADLLVLESTYGDRIHEGRKTRKKALRQVIEKCFENRGTVLIPAFSIGRTQELLYEIEQIIYQFGGNSAAEGIKWEDLDIIVDSPLANKFTEVYKELKDCWDKEAKRKVHRGRHPLSFEQLLTIESHQEHERIVKYLKQSGRPAIVIAASGMCSGGRIMNYLKALIEDLRTDILFVGYQAKGTPGRDIQKYGPRHGYVVLDERKYNIKAGVYTISGYSAHADQQNLIRFVKGMRQKPTEIRLIHGDQHAKTALCSKLKDNFPESAIL